MILRQILYTHWDLARWLHLTIGLLLIYVAFNSGDYMAGALGFFFSAKALLNVGCCTYQNCDTAPKYSHPENTNDVVFEEIKIK